MIDDLVMIGRVCSTVSSETNISFLGHNRCEKVERETEWWTIWYSWEITFFVLCESSFAVSDCEVPHILTLHTSCTCCLLGDSISHISVGTQCGDWQLRIVIIGFVRISWLSNGNCRDDINLRWNGYKREVFLWKAFRVVDFLKHIADQAQWRFHAKVWDHIAITELADLCC